MLALPIPFVVLLLLIVKSGMDAISFAAKHAMRPSCRYCADILLLLLILWLDDGFGLMTVFFVFTGMGVSLVEVMFCFAFDNWMLLGGSFYFLYPRSTFLSKYIATGSSIRVFLGCCLIALPNCCSASRIMLAVVN